MLIKGNGNDGLDFFREVRPRWGISMAPQRIIEQLGPEIRRDREAQGRKKNASKIKLTISFCPDLPNT